MSQQPIIRQHITRQRMGQAGIGRRGGLAMAAAVLLTGCGGGAPVVRDYPPLTYGYLTPLRLNVGSVEVDDSWTPSGGADVSRLSPARPVVALRQMALDRLVAGGTSGRAMLRIDDASILRIADRLDGHLAVTLTIYTSDGTRSAYAEARVARSTTDIPAGREGLRTALYRLTREMVDDMNVELEFQLRRSLRDWLLDANQAPSVVPGPVMQQPLNGAPPPSQVLVPPGYVPPGNPPPGSPAPGYSPPGYAPPSYAPPGGLSYPGPGSGPGPAYDVPAPGQSLGAPAPFTGFAPPTSPAPPTGLAPPAMGSPDTY